MKIGLIFTLLLSFGWLSCQTTPTISKTYELRTDTLDIFNPNKIGAELRLQNSTRHTVGGVLTTIDTAGLTQFKKLRLVNVSTTGIGIVGQDSVILPFLPLSGGTIGTTDIVTTNAHKMMIGMYTVGTGHTNAPKTLDYNSAYLGLGGREYGANSYRMIGFGYRSGPTNNYPASIGYQEISTPANTYGDLILATRPTTSDIAPTIRMRVTSAGAVKVYSFPVADEDVATKKYVDSMIAQKIANYLSSKN